MGVAAGWGLASWRAPSHGNADQAAPAAAQASAGRQVLYWYDPMKPDQKFDKPGKSPFMDMDLVPRYADEAGAGAGGSGVAVSPQAVQSLGVRLAVAEARSVSTGIDAVGTVQLNERDVSIVQKGIPDSIPVEFCYLGWQESLEMLAKLVEPEIPDGA